MKTSTKPSHFNLDKSQVDYCKNAIYRTWEAICSDMPEDTDNMQALEVVFDADYMKLYGGDREVAAHASELFDHHNPNEVYKFFARHIKLV